MAQHGILKAKKTTIISTALAIKNVDKDIPGTSPGSIRKHDIPGFLEVPIEPGPGPQESG